MTRFPTTSSEPQVRDSSGVPTQGSRFLTASSKPQVRDSHCVPTLMHQGSRFLTTSFEPQLGDDHGVPAPDQTGRELVRVLDTPLPLETVVVHESGQVSAASPSRVISNLPVSEVLTLTVIDTLVGPQGEDDLRTQRREAILIDSSRVPQRPSSKKKDKSLRASRSTAGNASDAIRSIAVESSGAYSTAP